MKNLLKAIKLGACLSGALFIMSSCNSQKDDKTADTTVTTAAPVDTTTAAPAPTKLTDPEIASVTVTANQIDIDYAKIALEKSKNPEVRKFATTMTKDHKSVIDQAVALVTKLKVTPLDNPTTQSLVKDATNTKEMFKTKTGADFDKAYVDNEVAYHKAAIDLVENTLVADATNAELKSLLQSVLPLFKEHLAHAEMMQKNLNK